MFGAKATNSAVLTPLDPLDRIAVGYLCLPLVIFLLGWFELWAAVPMVACVAYALKGLAARAPAGGARLPITWLQLAIAVAVGCGWTVFGGTDHLVFANADWHIRDAVLHDLVASPWPVGYGVLDGKESLLRAPIAYYLPAALIGKMAGLAAAHLAMAVWTALGATLFLLQVLSLTPSRLGVAVTVAAVVVLFSGLDIVGNLLNAGPRFRTDWNITMHLEWWAGKYQYSSMTTQLFWVPNHALGGWLAIGLLCRNERGAALDCVLPMAVVALALWSPLTALGAVPFALWRVVLLARASSLAVLHPRVWAPALVVGIVVAAYLTLDPGSIPKGMSVSAHGDTAMELLQQVQFFLLEAGFIGAAILAIRRSAEITLALVILALLPLAYFGPGNDLVMRASIPSLAVLTIGACLALFEQSADKHGLRKKAILAGLLLVGAVTPFEEFARAAVLPAWPINMRATLIAADCGRYAPHYVARLGDQLVGRVLRAPHRLALGALGPQACDNPAFDLMWQGAPL
jgi:hypothetical protein